MRTKKKIALAGLVGSFFLSLGLIHWFLADVLVRMTGISRDAAIGYGITLLTVLTAVRAILILLNKDAATRWINKE